MVTYWMDAPLGGGKTLFARHWVAQLQADIHLPFSQASVGRPLSQWDRFAWHEATSVTLFMIASVV